MKAVIRAHNDIVDFCRRVLKNWLSGDPLEIEVKPYDENASLSQKALVHIWFRELARNFTSRKMKDPDTGELIVFTEKYVKEDMKCRYGVVLGGFTPEGDEKSYQKSLGDYGKLELSEFLTKIHVYACDLSINLSVRSCEDYDNYRQAAE